MYMVRYIFLANIKSCDSSRVILLGDNNELDITGCACRIHYHTIHRYPFLWSGCMIIPKCNNPLITHRV